MHIYTIRIVYKSGYTHDFDATEFTITNKLGGLKDYKWTAVDHANKPLMLGAEGGEIAAVWQVGHREVPDAVLE